MPLSQGQKSLIESSIDHFFYELDEQDQDVIQAFINEIKKVFSNQSLSKDLFSLRNFFCTPQEYLKNLDQYGDINFTNSEIREYIIEFSDIKIKEAAGNVAIIDDEVKATLNWDKDEVIGEMKNSFENKVTKYLTNLINNGFNKLFDFVLDRGENPSQESTISTTSPSDLPNQGLHSLLSDSNSMHWVARIRNDNCPFNQRS